MLPARKSIIFLTFYLFVIFTNINCENSLEISTVRPENIRTRLFKKEINGSCSYDQFRCHNGRCIERRYFCNKIYDCDDDSDEWGCKTACGSGKGISCANDYYTINCMPQEWECDGIKDCFDGRDEQRCDHFETGVHQNQILKAKLLATSWISNQRKNTSRIQKWGVNIPRTAVVFYFSGNSSLQSNYNDEFAYELSIRLLSKFALKNVDEIKTTELAIYVNSFLALCINPRKFYMIDLISELRKRVDASEVANPFVMLALCNAQEFITLNDIEKLLAAFQKANAEHRTDTQAIIVMALACASLQPDSSFNREELPDYTLEIKKKQYRNGTVENIKTTALVLQALFASEPEPDDDNFDEEKAIKQILRSQEKDGSFGGLMNTYYVLPVLSMSSLVNISGEHCPKFTVDENAGLEHLKIQIGVKWNISYSIWIGDDKFLQRSLTLSVPANTSFYGIMEFAAGVDERYKFDYNVRSRKPYIFALSGIMDDPEFETFWYPYYLFSNSSEPTLITKSPADVIPTNNDHMLFWYRKVF